MSKVTFATKCWGQDWRKMLAGAFERKVASCQYPFHRTLLLANNGVPDHTALFGLSDVVINVSSAAPAVLKHFGLMKEDFQGGYNYSIAELTALWYNLGNADYLCYLQGDCLIDPAYDWVTPGVKMLEENPEISVISPASACNTWHDPITKKDQFFSDQAFLVRVREFRQPIYNEPGDLVEFPSHGGNSFEHMCAKYLRNAGKYRYIEEAAWLQHPAY